MAWTDLKAAVAAVIKTNGTQAITGALLQSTLSSIIDQVGANATFKGVATPTTTPGTPDGPVFYIASTQGTYANFGGFVLDGGLAVLSNVSGPWAGTKFLKTEMDAKADHGYGEGETVKTVKDVDDELVQVRSDLNKLNFLKLDSSIYNIGKYYLETTGQIGYGSSWSSTDLKNVIPGKTLKFIDSVNGELEFCPIYFDSNMGFISAEHMVTSSVVPSNAVFVGINIYAAVSVSDISNCYIYGITEQEEYNADNKKMKANVLLNTKTISVINQNLYGQNESYYVNKIADICSIGGYMKVTNGVFSLNFSIHWAYSAFVPISQLGLLKTFLDTTDKPAISYFSAKSIDSYISSEFNLFSSTIYDSVETPPTIPSNAEYFMIQYKLSQIDNCTYHYAHLPQIDKYISKIDSSLFTRSNKPLNEICIINGWFSASGGVITLNESLSWRRSGLLPIKVIDGMLKTYIDTTDKPAISYFSANSIDSYISSEFIETSHSFYNQNPTIPSNAQYFMIQCLNSQIGTATLMYEEENTSTKDGNELFFNVTENKDLVSDDNWMVAIQSALNLYKKVYIPYKDTPYQIDGTLVIKSGTHLLIDPNAIIQSTSAASMLRNENLLAETFDHNITLEGGVFDQNNYVGAIANGAGCAVGFLGVDNLTIKNISIINPGAFALQINSAKYLNIDGVYFDSETSDGLHMGGDISEFNISNISGNVGDDMVALNAWDWQQSTPRAGNIKNGRITNVNGYAHAHLIRLLGAIQDGVNCNVDGIIIDNVRGHGGLSVLDIGYQADSGTTHVVTATKLGNIRISNVNAYCTSGMGVKLSSDIGRIELNNCLISSLAGFSFKQLANTTIDRLILKGFSFEDSIAQTGSKCKMEFAGTIKNMIIRDAFIKSTDTTSNLIALYSVGNLVLDSNFIEGFNNFISMTASNSIYAKFINNKITVNTNILALLTSCTQATFKLIANEFAGSGYVLNNSIGGFTPDVKSCMNELTTISQSNGLCNWSEII